MLDLELKRDVSLGIGFDIELPNKPSELLALALDDAGELRLRAPDMYKPCSSSWIYKQPDDVCKVCLAGFILANHSDVEHLFGLHVSASNEPDVLKLRVVDELRSGNIGAALEILGLEKPASLQFYMEPPRLGAFYDWETFKQVEPFYEKLYSHLHNYGL